MSAARAAAGAQAPEEERRFLSAVEAAALERELLEDYRFARPQLAELCGQASAVAVTKVWPLPALSRKQRTVLVVCGPEHNGAVGLACARHLRVFVSSGDPGGWGVGASATLTAYPPGVRAQRLLPHALARAAAPRPDHSVREDGHPLPVLPAGRGPAHQRRLRAGGGRRAGPMCAAGCHGGALCAGAGDAQAAVHPGRQPGHPLRLGPRDRRGRGRAAPRRAGVAGGPQALRPRLLGTTPLRGRQVRPRRRAAQVRAAPAPLRRHRVRGPPVPPIN
ncbi:yjeF N-terminal domain-containing protein 3 isoform X1 [Erinaceus europaeus]|uniref:YjeF N-terminal domain-containing protein 3 isoform X1 n=1 Tax=Erinaceus europaeus TaxID=9365 RepID=A0ABM3WMQ3_ERIEU|nr:yjeF N-terminal domain-containing protein 3 isoform X1 [Erinaceus europaeus]